MQKIPSFWRDINIWIRETQSYPNRLKPQRSSLSQIMIKMSKVKEKEFLKE